MCCSYVLVGTQAVQHPLGLKRLVMASTINGLDDDDEDSGHQMMNNSDHQRTNDNGNRGHGEVKLSSLFDLCVNALADNYHAVLQQYGGDTKTTNSHSQKYVHGNGNFPMLPDGTLQAAISCVRKAQLLLDCHLPLVFATLPLVDPVAMYDAKWGYVTAPPSPPPSTSPSPSSSPPPPSSAETKLVSINVPSSSSTSSHPGRTSELRRPRYPSPTTTIPTIVSTTSRSTTTTTGAAIRNGRRTGSAGLVARVPTTTISTSSSSSTTIVASSNSRVAVTQRPFGRSSGGTGRLGTTTTTTAGRSISSSTPPVLNGRRSTNNRTSIPSSTATVTAAPLPVAANVPSLLAPSPTSAPVTPIVGPLVEMVEGYMLSLSEQRKLTSRGYALLAELIGSCRTSKTPANSSNSHSGGVSDVLRSWDHRLINSDAPLSVSAARMGIHASSVSKTTKTILTNDGFAAQSFIDRGHVEIVWLDLSFAEQLSDHSLSLITSHCPLLRRLDVTGCTKITNNGLVEVTQQCPFVQIVCCELLVRLDDSCLQVSLPTCTGYVACYSIGLCVIQTGYGTWLGTIASA
jgi:hypothetical protein